MLTEVHKRMIGQAIVHLVRKNKPFSSDEVCNILNTSASTGPKLIPLEVSQQMQGVFCAARYSTWAMVFKGSSVFWFPCTKAIGHKLAE